MFDFNTIQKTFETQSKMFADVVQPKELKDVQKASKEFALSVLDNSTKATLSGIQFFNEVSGSKSTTYLMKVTELVEAAHENAKEIIQTGTIKGFALNGNKK
jgi:hypothetical protein